MNHLTSEPNNHRRQFLQKSSALAVGAGLASSLNIARAAHAFGDDELKIGLVGCGGRGTGAANDCLTTSTKVRLVAVADAFQDRLDGCVSYLEKEQPDKVSLSADSKYVGFDAYQKVLASDIDLVILATPPGFRPIHFEAAVNAGKHVFMGKPVAVDGPGIRKVLEAAKVSKEKGLGAGVGLQRRHDPQYIESVKRLQEGAIGDILFSRVYWNGSVLWVRPRQPGQTEMEYQMRNWYYFNWLCGDHIVEQHIHNLDVSNWVRNMVPVSAQGQGGRQVRTSKECGQIFDHHMVEYTYPDGSKMLSQCRHIPNCWDAVEEHFHGTKGQAKLSDRARQQIFFEPDGKKVVWRYDGNMLNSYKQEHEDLIASIRAGNPYNEAEYGATSTMTAILGRMATYGGKIVTWDQALNSEVNLAPAQYAFDAQPPVVPDANGNYPVPKVGEDKVV